MYVFIIYMYTVHARGKKYIYAALVEDSYRGRRKKK